ncbi:nucleotide exchange factor GrpE [bacterium]|nr:nucleotide exchange factor GrpE [bacterium]
MQDHDQETEVVEEDVAATEEIVEENENEEVPEQEVPEVPLTPEAEAMKWKEAAIRSAADLDNYRKRMARERSEDLRFARSGLIEELLPIFDNFSMGQISISYGRFHSGPQPNHGRYFMRYTHIHKSTVA